MFPPYLSRLLKRIAHRVGAEVKLEPEFGYVGEIIFNNGYRHLFRGTNLNINLAGSVAIADDKAYTSYLLRGHGLPVPSEVTFFNSQLLNKLPQTVEQQRTVEHAVKFAERVGYPVFVKPNRGSKGELVCKAEDEQDIRYAAREILSRHLVGLVQRFVPGRDCRVVTLAGEVVSAYERRGLSVRGDGISTIQELLEFKRIEFEVRGRPGSEVNLDDFRIDWTLRRASLGRGAVLPMGTEAQILSNANLSTGGEAIDVTESISPQIKKIASMAAAVLGLSLAGVDLLCSDGAGLTADYCILEVNGSPGLDNYAAIGAEQEKRVEEIYVRVLDYLRNRGPLIRSVDGAADRLL